MTDKFGLAGIWEDLSNYLKVDTDISQDETPDAKYPTVIRFLVTNTAQTQDREWIAAGFQQTEQNRLEDKAQLINGLETLALQTEDELQRTRQEMAQFLTYSQPDNADVDK